MKHIPTHPPEKSTGRKYWRSLDELADTPEFRAQLEREFPAGAAELEMDGVSRRNFLKLMGASTALAGLGLTACHRPAKHLVPFTQSHEWAIPGKPLFFATAMPRRSGAMPLVVTTHDGRPTKIEGNPLHPASKGATDVFAQASILDLYDPDRSRFFLEHGKQSDEKSFEAYLDNLIKGLGDGSGLAFLVEQNNSPTRERLLRGILERFPKAKWAGYEPLRYEPLRNSSYTGAAAAFGLHWKGVPRLEKVDVILALDNDFLGTEQVSLDIVRAFADRRRVEKPGDKMNRLYVVENRYTVTGGMADHRLRIPASHIGAFALALAEKLGVDTDSVAKPGKVDFPPGWVEALAEDLKSARGRSLVLVGARQPGAVQQMGLAINRALGNLQQTLLEDFEETADALTISELAAEIGKKTVQTLFILGGNPVYNAPADLDWAKLQQSVREVIRLGLYEDETSQFARWHVPAAHYLEAWGDGLAADRSYLAIQPMILPLYGGWSELDILAKVAGIPKPKGPELVQETFRWFGATVFEEAWNTLLHDGFWPVWRSVQLAFPINTGAPGEIPTPVAPDSFEIVFPADSKMDDGRYNNNGWLQELPDPITKTTWDNVAWISPKTAKQFGIKQVLHNGADMDVIEIEVNGRKLEAPAFVVPGHADNSISLSLGYGRSVVGRVGKGTGVNAYSLRTTDTPYFAIGAKVRKVEGKTYKVSHTQEHFNMEGRALVREASLEEFDQNPGFVKEMGGDEEVPPGNPSLYSHPWNYSDPNSPGILPNQWGMAIDLNTCLGCSACVVACQAENNIPIVGKEQVARGRFMQWMRSDRYFVSGTDLSEDMGQYPDDPEMVMQPMLCQQCEYAPCETVCPVNATVHSPDGLNVMVYNRCIGTRYCANNCPFKVRRFNFFDYNQRPITPVKTIFGEVSGLLLGPLTKKGTPDTIKMQKNPNVTVRMRGVMEKCTFCVQRIQEARIAQKVKAGATDDVRIPPDTFMTACQQVCPASAIVFGDISNPESQVSKLKKQEKNYRLLQNLNLATRVSYLARLRNPNPKMPGAKNG